MTHNSKPTRRHKCAESRSCCCRIDGLEPNEDCPVHGAGPWPPRCAECGKFLSWEIRSNIFEQPHPEMGERP